MNPEYLLSSSGGYRGGLTCQKRRLGSPGFSGCFAETVPPSNDVNTMQAKIQSPGETAIFFRCNVCPIGCELIDHQAGTAKAVMHNHHCHRFPSLMTAWTQE